MKRVLILLFCLDRVNAAELLYHTCVQSCSFFQFRCNDESLAFQFCHLRLHIALAIHGQCLSRDFAGVVSEYTSNGVPEGGLAVGTAAVSNDHMLRIHLADCCHTYDFLHIGNQRLVLAEESIQSVQPKLHPLISWRAVRHLGNEVIRVMRVTARHAFGEVIGLLRCIQQFCIVVQLRNINRQHRLCRILRIHDVFVVAVFHHKLMVGLRTDQCIQQPHLRSGNSLFQSLTTCTDRFFRHSCCNQCILCAFDGFVRIGKLNIQEILRNAESLLRILMPAITAVSKKPRGIGETQTIHVLSRQHLCLTNIGIILRLHTTDTEFIIELVWRDISVLCLNLICKLHSALPDAIKLRLGKRRFTFLSTLHIQLMRLVRNAELL